MSNYKGCKRTCKVCGTIFPVTNNKSRGQFCSKFCRSKLHNDVPKKCQYCGKDFLSRKIDSEKGWGRFCSRSCANLGQRTRYGKGNAYRSYNPARDLYYRCWRDEHTSKTLNQIESRWVWEMSFGPLPKNLIIHHRNGNKHDDHISNLKLGKNKIINLKDFVSLAWLNFNYSLRLKLGFYNKIPTT